MDRSAGLEVTNHAVGVEILGAGDVLPQALLLHRCLVVSERREVLEDVAVETEAPAVPGEVERSGEARRQQHVKGRMHLRQFARAFLPQRVVFATFLCAQLASARPLSVRRAH